MASEISAVFTTGRNLYALVRSSTGRIWNGTSFETYATGNYSNYPVAMTQQGTSESFYAGNFPLAITAGVYNIVVKARTGVSPAETDPAVAMGSLQWNGSSVFSPSDLPTSGQLSRYLPITAYQGQMISPFKFKLVSAADSRTPFTSGTVSGQISRDTGFFGPLESGSFVELGLGWYATTLTSGDMNARSVALNFTATRSGGGVSDPRDFLLLLQTTSG